MESIYDIVVVGAGPSGSCAALAAAKKGANTLLIDKRDEVGDDNHCGELLPSPKEMKDLLPKADGAENLAEVPRRFIMARTRILRLISPSGRSWEFPFESNIIDRRGFEKHLAIEASRFGADVWPSTRAVGMLDDKQGIQAMTRGKNVEIRSSIIIGCDGFGSRIAKWAGLGNYGRPKESIVGVQYEMSRVEVEKDTVEMYFGANVAPGGYAWIIPKGDDVANVGLGIRSAFSEKGISIMEYLRRFLNFNKVASEKVSRGTTIAFRKGVIPVGGPIERTFRDNVILAGDSAGFAMAANGGGMPPGMVTGKIAGEIAADHLHKGVELSKYEEEWNHQIGKEIETAVEIRRLMDKAIISDEKMESIMRRLGARYMGELIRCRLPRTLKLAARIMRI